MARRRFSWGFMAPPGWMEPHRTRRWACVQSGQRVRSSGPDEAGAGYRGLNHRDPFGLCPQSITGRPCTTIHRVGTLLGAGTGALIGGTGGAVAGTVVLPVAGTVGGGAAGVLAGTAEGGVLGLAAANLAVE